MELALAGSEALYRSLFEHACIMIMVIDSVTAAIVDANLSACKFYGYSRTELVQRKILDLTVLPHEQVWERIRKVAVGEITYMILPHHLPNGYICQVELYLRRHTFPDGQSINIAIIHDITGRLEAEAALWGSEARFSTIFNSSHVVISLSRLHDDVISSMLWEKIAS